MSNEIENLDKQLEQEKATMECTLEMMEKMRERIRQYFLERQAAETCPWAPSPPRGYVD